MFKRLSIPPLVLAIFWSPIAVSAHEFWLEPRTYTPEVEADIPVTLHVGQNFSGAYYPYLIDRFYKFTAEQNEPAAAIDGLEGDDDPAVTLEFEKPRLAIVAYHSKSFELTYEKFEKFESFLQSAGQAHILAQHRSAGKPETEIEERYYRAAKLLLNVGGTGIGEDRFTGMPLELVAERNPYSLSAGEELPVRLLHNGKPIEGVLVTAFQKKAAPEAAQKRRTDKNGRASIPLPNSGAWLLNAVHIVEPAPDEYVHWVSLWASMTFERP